MTEQELRDIETQANNASVGPWFSGPLLRDIAGDYVVWQKMERGRQYIANVGQMTEPVLDATEDTILLFDVERNDAEFVAAARTNVPRLVAEVRRLTERIDSIIEYAVDVFACDICDRHSEHIRSLSFADFYDAESGRGCTYCDTERLAKLEEEVTRLRAALERITTCAATPTWTAADVARQALEASS